MALDDILTLVAVDLPAYFQLLVMGLALGTLLGVSALIISISVSFAYKFLARGG